MTELVAGRPLKGKLPVADAIDAARQIARGLAAAHSAGVIHRDLKPDNILRTRDGRLKIVDFGLAKMRERTDGLAEGGDTLTLHTQPGMAAGTAGYMSPEQVRGEEVDGRSDIFNIGLILYEMLSGERAFRATTSIEMLHAILKDAPPLAAQQSAGSRLRSSDELWERRCSKSSAPAPPPYSTMRRSSGSSLWCAAIPRKAALAGPYAW